MTLTIPGTGTQEGTRAGAETAETGKAGCWDALELPAEAGRAVLRRLGAHAGPALLRGERMLLLVPEGSAEELPGLLEWLEWTGIDLDLTAHSGFLRPPGGPDARGGPDGPEGSAGPDGPGTPEGPAGGDGPRGAAQHWVRPPGQGREHFDAPLVPDLVRLVSAAATECHRARLARCTRPQRQTPAFS